MGIRLRQVANLLLVILLLVTPAFAGHKALSGVSIPQGTGPHTVTLSWDPSTTAGVTYFMFRGTTPGGEGSTSLNATGIVTNCTDNTTCTYVDTTVVGGTTYYYFVEAQDTTQTNSPPSNEAQAIVPLAAPSGLTIINHN